MRVKHIKVVSVVLFLVLLLIGGEYGRRLMLLRSEMRQFNDRIGLHGVPVTINRPNLYYKPYLKQILAKRQRCDVHSFLTDAGVQIIEMREEGDVRNSDVFLIRFTSSAPVMRVNDLYISTMTT